jgi:hypothetical protein
MSTGLMVSGTYTNVCINCSSTSYTTNIRGVEFSPNGNYVYVVGNYTGIMAIQYSSPTTTTNISTGSSSVRDFIHSQIELGKDGNLYLVGQHGASTPVM